MKKVTPKSLTRPLKQYEVAATAVYLLGGASRSIDTEDVAVKCHELAGSLFSWQKYKEQINLELVRVSLSDAKKAKNGGLLSGSGREGWRLSSKGLDWMRARQHEADDIVTREQSPGRGKAGSIDSVRRERERQRILGGEAWQAWRGNGAMSVRYVQQLFRIDEYTTERMIAIKVARLRAMFNAEDELSRFLSEAAEKLLKEASDDR